MGVVDAFPVQAVGGVIAASRESTINKALLAGCNDKTRQYFVNMKGSLDEEE